MLAFLHPFPPPPGCEDLVVDSLSLDSVVPILKWSSQPYGSKWVHRQAVHFLCEEFSQVMTSDVLYELSKEHLLTAIQSDYLQVRSPTGVSFGCGPTSAEQQGKPTRIYVSVVTVALTTECQSPETTDGGCNPEAPCYPPPVAC